MEVYKLIFSEVLSNNNKFYYGTLHDDGRFVAEYGRVGKTKQVEDYGIVGKAFADKKKREKIKKGYTELKTVDSSETVVTPVNGSLESIAKKQLIKVANSILESLIDRLIKANVHQITSSTQIKFDANTGLFSTPLGVVTLEGIEEARKILVWLKGSTGRDAKFFKKVSSYLRIIPQDLGMKINKDAIFSAADAIEKQSDILDSLEASYKAIQVKPKTQTSTGEVEQDVFHVDISVLEDKAEYKRLESFYEKSKKRGHGYDNVKIVNIYKVDIHDTTNSFDSSMQNVTEVFHGTGQANILSILKSGIKVSPPSTAAIAGKMFGNGVYGAISSSKSLGYTLGRWTGQKGDAGYLFICDFAMGNIDYTNGAWKGSSSYPAKGCDSVHAKSGACGLAHDELIVYKNKQVKVKYLLEVK